MKRSWLIGAALLFSLSAVACGGDDDSTGPSPDGGKSDGSVSPIHDGGIDGSVGLDSGTPGSSDGGSDAEVDAG